MNTSPTLVRSLWALLSLCLAGMFSASGLYASGPAIVGYAPSIKPIQGELPLKYPFILRIGSPSNLPSGSHPVGFRVEVSRVPEGVDIDTARGYVTFSPSTIEFTRANQAGQVEVTLNIPGSATPGDYGYQVYAEGWQTDAVFGNPGASINVTATENLKPTPPTVTINSPANNAVFTMQAGSTSMQIPVSVAGSGTRISPITSLRASFQGVSVPLEPTGINTPTATGTGSLTITQPGTYTISAEAESNGGLVPTSHEFTVAAPLPPTPTIVITSPTAAVIEHVIGTPKPDVPFSFTTTTTAGYVVSDVSATLDGASVAIASSPGLGSEATVVSSGTLSAVTPGAHTLVVYGTSAGVQVSASFDFTVEEVQPPAAPKITGQVFFDLNGNGEMDGADFGLAGIAVKLFGTGCHVIGTAETDSSGSYVFADVQPGTYKVWTQASCGFLPTTSTTRTVVVTTADVVAEPIGYKLNLCALVLMRADGNSHGFWKTNIDKALDGKTKGVQVSASTLRAYTASIAEFASSSYDGITLEGAYAVLNAKSSRPAALLSKQLIAAEYNYQNGAYLNGNATLTYAFVAWGEYVLENADSLPCWEVLWAKDWFDAYNNSHGGFVGFP